MAGTITVALRTAQSGLLTHQAGIDATANNIANVNTEGYSRKLVNMEQRVLAGVGAGVQLTDFTRAVDEGLLKDLRRELSDAEKLETQVGYFERVQAVFGSPESNTSFSHTINEFTKAAETLSVNPAGALEQQEFVRWANEVALQFQELTEELQALRIRADQEIATEVAEINRLTDSIADLNDKIIRNRAVTHDVTDLEDQRDKALTDLSKLIDITYYQRGDGDMVVFTQNGSTLVDRTAKTMTHTAVATVSATSTYAEGDINPIYVGETIAENDITTSILGGKMAGLIAQRDTVLPNLQSQMDELASELRDVMNQIHNRGTAHPGLQEMVGTRTIIDADNQKIQLDPSGSVDDVSIVLFNSSGEEQVKTTLNTIMTSGTFGTGAQTSRGPWSITEVADTIEDWLKGNGAASASVSVNSDDKFEVQLNSSTLYLGFRDESATADGSTHEDASIGFDSDGDGDNDATYSGFANFFGLNDLYIDDTTDANYESATVSTGWSGSAATLTFYDSQNGVGASNELGTVSITSGSSLSTISTAINDADIGVTASVVPDGSGERLVITNNNGRATVVTQGASDTLLTDLGLAASDRGVTTSIALRTDIKGSPGLLSTGKVQWDSDNSSYFVSEGDNANVEDMTVALTTKNSFDTAGGFQSANAAFNEYAADVIASNSSLASTNEHQLDIQRTLADSLEFKAETFSGVNLDEEMSNLILYQQAYTASARVISVVQKLFDTLNDAVR